MKALISQRALVAGVSPDAASGLAAERLGREWLEERDVVVSDGGVSLSASRPVHGPDVVARSGYYDATGARVAMVARPSFQALTGTDSDYAVASNPMNIAQLGFGLFPPDIWLGPAPFRVVAAERFNTTILTWAWSQDAVAFLSIAQDTGHRVLLTVLDVRTGATTRYGLPGTCEDDMISFSPDDRELWLGAASGRPCALDLTSGELRSTSLPSGQGFAWSPDGVALAVTHGTSVTVIRGDADGRTFDLGVSGWLPVWLDDAHLGVNGSENVQLPHTGDEYSLDVIRVLRLSDGYVETVLPTMELQPGFLAVPRLLAVDAPRTPTERWWDELLGPSDARAVQLRDISFDSLQYPRFARSEKLRLTHAARPDLHATYRRAWDRPRAAPPTAESTGARLRRAIGWRRG